MYEFIIEENINMKVFGYVIGHIPYVVFSHTVLSIENHRNLSRMKIYMSTYIDANWIYTSPSEK